MKLAKSALILVLAVALPAAAVAGCGGGGSSTSSTTTASTATATTQKKAEKQQKQKSSKQGGSRQEQLSGSAPTDPGPLPNQGTKAVAPGVPTVKHGDNSIQTYGTETSATQRIAATRLVKSFLDNEAAGSWDTACGELRSLIRNKLTQLVKRAPASVGHGCAAGMRVLLSKTRPSVFRSAARIHVLSFRSKGPQAFLIYRDGAGKAYNLPLRREGGQWKIGALIGVALVL